MTPGSHEPSPGQQPGADGPVSAADLARLDALPVTEQAPVYADLLDRLQAELATLDEL